MNVMAPARKRKEEDERVATQAILEHPLRKDPGAEAIMAPVESGRQRMHLKSTDLRLTLGLLALLGGFVAVVGAWVGVSGAGDTGSQLSYITSGGLGGAALIAIGVLLVVASEHSRDRAALETLADRLHQLEESLERGTGDRASRADG
jgi:hypothetical protein